MKYVYAIATIFLLASCKEAPTTVHLKGQLDGLGNVVTMSYNGAASMLGDSRDIKIYPNEAGFFDTIISLTKPEYYSIRRNTLYLTPGDDMEIYIADMNTQAKFTGKGAEVNEYMKGRLFPKGGSILEAGKNVKEDFSATKLTVDSLAKERLGLLNALKEATPEFKDLETARINADVLNSYISYMSYSSEFRNLPKEEAAAKKEQFIKDLQPAARELLSKITNEKFLNIAVVRDIIGTIKESPEMSSYFNDITLPERTEELFTAYSHVSELRQEVSNDIVSSTTQYAKSMKNEDFKTEVQAKIAQASKLLAGQPAPDITFEDAMGNVQNISDYKGKVIYIDFWATWCGPCIQESPIFNELSKKYEGKDIVFLQISTDKRRADWEKYIEKKQAVLPQFISTDTRLADEWAIFYIPRFVLIDKNFNIVEAYAKRPSDEGIHSLLDSILQ